MTGAGGLVGLSFEAVMIHALLVVVATHEVLFFLVAYWHLGRRETYVKLSACS